MAAATVLAICALAAGLGAPSAARADKPMSAIDWLSRSVTAPPTGTGAPGEATPGTLSVAPPAPVQGGIDVSVIGRVSRLDAVGLLPVSVTGLPRDIWGASASADLAGLVRDAPVNTLPALQDLLYTLLLAEVDPPADAGASGSFLLARIDKLLDMGALDQAQALLELSGTQQTALFRRWFDVELLLGQEDEACNRISRRPEIAPTYPVRIFCLARKKDWGAAHLSLVAAEGLGLIRAEDQPVLDRFLDSGSDDDAAPLAPPDRPSPLIWRMMEAIGEPLPTTTLPLAFAQADLRSNRGWKPQIDAAERLARAGAVSPNRLIGIYMKGKPAASGDPWDRVAAVQKLDDAVSSHNVAATAAALAPAWTAMARAGLAVPFATLYGRQLVAMHLPAPAAEMAFHIGLLSPDYEVIADMHAAPAAPEDSFLIGLARGQMAGLTAPDSMGEAVAAAFTGTLADDDPLTTLTREDKLGEAVLRAISRISDGSSGDLRGVTQGLSLLRRIGLESTARRTALQLMLLRETG